MGFLKKTGKVRKLAMGILVVMAGFLCTGCISMTKEPLPEETIEEFEDAVNAMDVDGMMDCMSEKTVKSLTAGMDVVMGIAEAVAGIDLGLSAEDLLALMPLMQPFTSSYMGEAGYYPEVDFQVTKTYIKKDRATVFFTEANTGEDMVINMEKEDGKWVMTMDMRVIAEEEADQVIVAGEADVPEDEGKETGSADLSILDLLDGETLKEYLRGLLGSPES